MKVRFRCSGGWSAWGRLGLGFVVGFGLLGGSLAGGVKGDGTTESEEGIRPLSWGHVNFVHTTDTHGWLPGHLSEPDFSANWGDYISFLQHMRELADEKGVDLIVVDTGDRHDGNGLSDATYPDGEISQQIFRKADIDIVAIGNHELYKSEVTSQEYHTMRPYYGEKYISSNIDVLDETGTGEWLPMGQRYRLFQTKNQNLTVLALGFLFNFKGNDYNSRVNKVQDVIKEDWFQEVIRTPNLDLVVLTGHAPVRYFDEFDAVVKEIRSVWPKMPIQALGGHTHIRDYRIYDDYAVGLESGRFLETIGFASVNLSSEANVQQTVHSSQLDKTNKQNEQESSESGFGSGFEDSVSSGPTFTRRYIDFNVRSLSTHAEKSLNEFYTAEGNATTQSIIQFREQLNLTDIICCVPQTYYTTRAKYPGPDSLFTLLEEEVLPLLSGVVEPSRDDHPRFILLNTGALRFDLFRGPFTVDTGYIVAPFRNEWIYIPSMPIKIARQILPLLNQEGSILSTNEHATDFEELDFTELGPPEQRGRGSRNNLSSSQHRHNYDEQLVFSSEQQQQQHRQKLTDGYVTHDDLGSDGDDTPHNPWPFYDIPNVIQASDNIDRTTTHVDLIFYDFMKPFIVHALKTLRQDQYANNIVYYGGNSVISLLPEFLLGLETGTSCIV
ncbi:hypothetical protein AWJ20_4680 [Sugiyamaella lignohabitans]|uniref:Putative 5'-nucleotidase C-terminal domain-containing protein n=1 Tax=Sugiyamaella lignohabitans TaxID=796027 RepID=A0A167E7H8_9ASCO|nr:uncharacterized protein AWJ20_4680 [Sugiyamaella lignohabitans]ANB13736.1 hypothetical protein AWJ20_4680 [Sugiyamaella lignohabitans]